MAYPNRGVAKAAMKHYLTESARTALEALQPDEDVVELGPGKQMPVVGPNQILDMPLFAKIPFLPGSNTMFYTTNLGEKLYQPSATFDLSDPYCKVMAPRYKSLHDPHLRAYYKRKDNLRRLKKAGQITDKNKVVCSLKEFNEYRQYLSSLKLEFEKHYMREQKMLEKQVTKLQEANLLPEGADTSKYRDWMLKEERPTIPEQEAVMRNRYLELINQELEKLEQLAEENRNLALAQDDSKKQGSEKRKQLLLRKKMEEEWRKKEMMLLMKIGDDVKREAKIEEQRRRNKEEKLKRKQAMLEKKMAHHLKKLQEQFEGEGFVPSGRFPPRAAPEDHGPPAKRLAPMGKKSKYDERKAAHPDQKPESLPEDKGPVFPEGGIPTQEASQASLSKEKSSPKPSLTTLPPDVEVIPCKSASFQEQETVPGERDLSRKGSLVDSAELSPSLLPQGLDSKVSLSTAKGAGSAASLAAGSINDHPSADLGLGPAESTDDQVAPSASAGAISTGGAPSACESTAGCGSKTSCCGSGGCGSSKSCCGPGGCGSKKSCCGSGGCGSKKSCCGSGGCGSTKSCCGPGGCGSKKSCCGLGGCGSTKSCCGSAGCGSSKSCCGSAGCGSKTCSGSAGCGSKTCCSGSCGCCSHSGKCCGSAGCVTSNGKGTGGSDSSGSSKPGAGGRNNKLPFSPTTGANQPSRTPPKTSAKMTMSSAVSQHTFSEGPGKMKHKKRATLMFSQCEPESLLKERGPSKKRRVDKHKREHRASASQDNEDSESSYSAYLQRLLSNSDHSALRESLRGKVSASELNSIIQNIMTWVVSAVTSILYPALTKFEERVRTRVYTISEESILSSDNSSTCSTCNEDFYEAYGSVPCASARKVSFTDTTIKPSDSSAREFHVAGGKPPSLLSSKSSFTSFTKSTRISLDSDFFVGKFKRGKAAILWTPSKHSGLLSTTTTTSMKSAKSDTERAQTQKGATEAPKKPLVASYHSKHKSTWPRGLFSKMDSDAAATTTAAAATTTTTTTDMDQVPLSEGEHKPLHGSEQRQAIHLKDVEGIFADLKLPLTQMTSTVLDDIFKQILGDLGCSACSVSLSLEILLESISENLLGSSPSGPPATGSVSRIASFVANDLVESVLSKLQSVAQKVYTETVSKDDFAAECKAMCVMAAGRHTLPDPAFWKDRMPLSLESLYGVADEIIQLILDKLKAFALSSQTKVSQFELFAQIKAIGVPLEQIYAMAPPHSVESEAATAIVKDTVRKIVSKTMASSETNILQYVEEMVASILSYLHRWLGQEGTPVARESSILLQLINEVFNSLSTEKLQGIYPAAKGRASAKTPGEVHRPESPVAPETKGTTVTTTTLFTAEMMMKRPFPPVNVPGMVVDPEAESEEKEKESQGEKYSSVTKERKVLVTGEEEEVCYESFGHESQPRSRPRPKSACPGQEGFLDHDGKTEPDRVEKMESCLENFVQEAIFCSLEGEQTIDPASGTKSATGLLEQALKKMEEDLEAEGSPIIPLVRNLVNEMFRRVWAERPLWPPASHLPPSLAHVGISGQDLEGQPPPKGHQPEGGGHPQASEADILGLTSELVKTAFQKISQATQMDPQGAQSRGPTLVITDILPLKEPAEQGKSLPTVHFKDPDMTFESEKHPPEGTQATAAAAAATTQEDPTQASQPEQRLLTKPDLARDLVETFITKLECFVASKVELQLGLEVESLKTSAGSDLCSSIQQELRRILASRPGSLPGSLEEIFRSYSNSLLADREKSKHALPLSYANLKAYAEEVARMMLKSLKHSLDKEVEKIPTPPVIFSESIAASHVVSMVFTVVAPREDDNEEAPRPFSRGESVLEKLLRKNAAYKRDLQVQIQNTVESFLNEIYDTIMLGMGGSSSRLSGAEKLQTPLGKESQALKAGDDRALPTPAVVESDISVVSSDLVNIIVEDLSSGLAAALHKKGPLSARLQSLLFELIQRPLERFAPAPDRRVKFGSQGESGPRQLPELRDFSPEGIAKYLVDNISLRLETFAEEKLESQLGAHLGESRVQGRGCREEAKLAVQDSQSNLRLCAEKLTCTILRIIQKDLEQEMLSCQNLLPYEDSASANQVVNDLLKILSVQVALTENEVHKRVLKRIFRRRQPGERGGAPLVARVEDVLNQVTQRIVGNLGHWPGFQNDSLLIVPESRSSAYPGMAETVSQMSAGCTAGEIVDGVLNKMYTVVADTLFSSSESGSGVESLSSDRGPCSTEVSRPTGKSDLRNMTLALSQLHPQPQSLGEELVQTVLNKIALFAASNLEEFLPLSVRQKRKRHATFQCDMQAGDGLPGQPRAFSEDSETSLMRVNLSKSDLTVYAKDVVGKVLGTLVDEFKAEDYHRTTLRVNTLSSEQLSRASGLVHSVFQDLHVTRRDRTEGLPSTQMYFHFESTVKDLQGKPKCLFYEDVSAYLRQVLPKEGILREIFEHQPWTDVNINESLRMLQVAENIVSEVFMRVRDLESSVGILQKIPGELSERLFCAEFNRPEAPILFHSDPQAEIGSVARDIVASVFENVHKCLACSVPAGPEKDSFPRRKDRATLRGSGRIHKHRFTQPEFPFYNVSLKGAMDTIDKIAKETVECVQVMLETFVARHFRRDFKCNFLEIVKFPLESLSFAQLTRSLDSLSAQVGNVAETTMEAFKNNLQGSAGRGALPTLGSAHNFLDFSKLGGAVTRECVETALRQVQMLQAELSVYANNAVSGILEIIKRTLDRELVQKENTLFSSSSESLVLSETVSVMLDRCNESLTEITSELMVENLQLEMSGRAFARDKALVRDLAPSPGVKTTSKKYRRVETFPPINVPGMVVYSEEEAEVQEAAPSKFPSVYKSSGWDVHVSPEGYKYTSFSTAAPGSRPPGRRRRDRGLSQRKPDLPENEWLPRQSSIPEGSVLEKLFKKTADPVATPGLGQAGPQSKRGLAHHHPHQEKQAQPFFGRGPALGIPESTCFSAVCPLKLGQTAETIVSALLGELGIENETEKARPHSVLKETSARVGASGPSALADPKRRTANLLNHWETRQGDASEESHAMMMGSCLLTREGSNSMLSKWESKQFAFGTKNPEGRKDLELLACSHIPDPSEIHLLANHIVLSVIKELISFRPKDALEEAPSWPAWKQELLQSESRWLQERIWRSSSFASTPKLFSCLEVLWEPLTLTVVSNVLLIISNPSIRHNAQEREECFGNHLSVFCSVDAGCPEHGPRGGPKSSPINVKELAFRVADGIVGTLCKRSVLHEGISRQGSRAKGTEYIYIPPLCLADFDDVYHLLVKEVGLLLSMEIERRGKRGDTGRAQDPLLRPHDDVPPVCFSRASRGDCRGPGDLNRMGGLSTVRQLACKNPRLSCVASNLDSFIRSLKSSESKRLVDKVLCIILDSLWPEPPQAGYPGSCWDTRGQDVMPYQEAGLLSKRELSPTTVCPHASQLSHNLWRGNLGLSPKSVVLLDVVSEKLIRSLLDKCLTTDRFAGPFDFDEFPEELQLDDVRKGVSPEEPFYDSRREVDAHEVDSSTSIDTYSVTYTEEPWVEAQSRPGSYETALDLLAHTLVKPVMTELSLSLDRPGYPKSFSKKAIGFTQPSSRKARGHTFPKKHGRHAKSGAYPSWPRGRKPEPKGPFPGRGQNRKVAHERNRSILETAMQHQGFDSRHMAPGGPPATRKPFPSTCTKKTYRREVVTVMGHGDHRRPHADFSVIYSSLFLEEVVSRLLITIFSSLQGKYTSDSCIHLREMNTLFVHALAEEFKRASVGVLPRAEEKWYFPSVDGQTINRVVDSIVREFGFQLAADRDIGRDVETLARRASEIILVEILDYQLPPALCRRLPESSYKSLRAEQIVRRIEPCIYFPKAPKPKRQPPPNYVTILSQKYLERVIHRLVSQLFPSSEGPPETEGKKGLSEADFDELCAHMIQQVRKSISKHKIWVAKTDDRCRLHSEKEIQGMVDSVYRNMVETSGSPLSVQKEVKGRAGPLVDSLTSFIIQEVTQHHLQTFLAKGEHVAGSPDPEALSENIVRTVLGSLVEPSVLRAELFPTKHLEEIVSRVLSRIFGVSSVDKKGPGKGRREAELARVAKTLAGSISAQFGRAAVTGLPSREERSLGAPLTDVMDDVVDSVCHVISKERGVAPADDLSCAGEKTLFENIKLLVGKQIANKLLHPLFSGDGIQGSAPRYEDVPGKAAEDIFPETQEENESVSPFSTFLSSGFLKDFLTGLLSKIFPSAPPREAASPWDQRLLLSESEIDKLSAQLLDDVRRRLLKHEIRVAQEGDPEQSDYSEDDVQRMTDFLCGQIIQKSGSLEAAQREVENKSGGLMDHVAGFLIANILQKHFQPFVNGEEPPALRDSDAAGDSARRLEVYRTMIKPLDLRAPAQEEKRGSPVSSFLGEIASQLFSKLSSALSDISLTTSGDNVGDVAARLAQSLTKELEKVPRHVQEGPDAPLGCPPPETGRKLPFKEVERGWLPEGNATDKREKDSSLRTATFSFEEVADHLLHSACPSNVMEAMCLIKERLSVDSDGSETKPPETYTTVVSYDELEAIVDRLLSQVFPSSMSSALGSGQGESPLGPERRNRVSQIKKDLVEEVLKQAIWTSTYGSEEEAGISEDALENMVESVYCDVLHEVMLRQPFPEDRDSLSNLYVTQIACFIINEMFKYHLQSWGSRRHLPGTGDLPETCVTIFPCSLLEKLLHQLLEKIFPTPDSIVAYLGKQVDFSEADFLEMATKLKDYIIAEISAHEIKLENASEQTPKMDPETEEDVVRSVYNQLLQKYLSLSELQNGFSSPGNGVVPEAAGLIVREILNVHLQPFLSGSDSSHSEEHLQWQASRHPFSRRVYSALFLEDAVVAFFCKLLSSPNILSYAKDTPLSEDKMRELVIELVYALVREFKMSDVKVVHPAGEGFTLPQVTVDDVIQASNAIYEKLLQECGSELEIFKAFQNNSHMLAEKLAPLMISEISGYQLMPLFSGDTSSYLFSFLEAETIVDRVETILPEPTSSRSVFGEMFVKILGRIFPSWASGGATDSQVPTMGERAKRGLAGLSLKEGGGGLARAGLQSLVENLCKTVCERSAERKYGSTAEEVPGFLDPREQDRPPSKSPSPPGQSGFSSTLATKTSGWTIHHVKIGGGEPQMTQIEDDGGVYPSAFLQDIFSGLIRKLLSSTPTGVSAQEEKEVAGEPPVKMLVESLLKEFAKSPVKVLQVPEEIQHPRGEETTDVAKIIHASLCSILQDQAAGVLLGSDHESQRLLVERLACTLKKELLDYQVQEMPPKTAQIPLCRPMELGEMVQKVLQEVKKAATPALASRPSPLLVSQRFIHEVLAFFLSKILPLPTAASTSSDTEDLCNEFDFVHMKLLSKVMAEISKDPNTEVQYLDRVQPNRVVSQTVANSVYNHLLPEFGSPSAVEKCIKAGCTILLERIVEFVLREVSGSKMQAYFLEERQRQQEALEVERELEERYREEPKLLEGETPLRSHLKGLSLIILEEVAARLLSKIFHSFPMDNVDERDLDSVREVARKIINSLQGLISKNKLKVRQPEHLDDLGSEDSQTVGEVVDTVYTDLLRHSSSEASLYEDLTSENKDLANRVACFMVSEISRRDFQSGSESEAESPRSSSALRLESDKIIQKFLGDMEAEKAKKDSLGAQVPMVPVAFLEEILTRFLSNIFLAQCDLGFHERKNLSKTDVNVIVGLLKTSVEKQISKNKIGLVASPDNQPMLDAQYEELVNQVVQSVIRNVMEKSGSQLELYNDMTTNQVIFPEQVASIIINEVSSCNIANGKPIQETGENTTRSALELDRIVSKVIARVSCHSEPDEDASLTELMDLPAAQAESIPEPEDLLESEELPVNIVPYLGGKPLKIDPNFVSDHLAVISIKTEPLNKLEKTCLSKTGMSLMELRRVSASGKSVCNNVAATDVNKRKERRPSLDMAGRLGVRPREAVCRNSFQSLMKPDIRKVELLKDVESKQDLMLRLVVHDISEDQHRWNPDVEGSDTDEEEQVLTEHRSFYFPPTAPQADSTASVYTPREFSKGSSLNQKKSMVVGRGYPSITVSGASSERKEGSAASTLPHISITAQSFVSQIPELDEEVSMSSTPHQEKSPPAMASEPSVHTVVSDDKSQTKEPSMEKVVGMHLSRDTEETSGHFEITSVYQDKKIQDSVSEQPSEVEDGKVISVTSSDQAMPERRRSSVLRRVSNTLSKVFSRTSALGEDKSAPGDRP